MWLCVCLVILGVPISFCRACISGIHLMWVTSISGTWNRFIVELAASCLFVCLFVCLLACLLAFLLVCLFVSGSKQVVLRFQQPREKNVVGKAASRWHAGGKWICGFGCQVFLLLHLCGADFPGLGGWSGVSKHPEALRMVAHLVYFTALQTRALLECFLDLQGGGEVFLFCDWLLKIEVIFQDPSQNWCLRVGVAGVASGIYNLQTECHNEICCSIGFKEFQNWWRSEAPEFR